MGDKGFLGSFFGSIDPETEFNSIIPEKTPTKINHRSILKVIIYVV